MNPLDIIEIPGYPGMYARRAVVDAWKAGGSPHINDGGAGRLYDSQKKAYDAFQDGKGSPADNPDDETQRLAHCRFGALDLRYPDHAKLTAAGLVRPYDYELWHYELPKIRTYPIVRSIPKPLPIDEESEDMRAIRKANEPHSGIIIRGVAAPYSLNQQRFEATANGLGLSIRELPGYLYDTIVEEQWAAFNSDKKLRS